MAGWLLASYVSMWPESLNRLPALRFYKGSWTPHPSVEKNICFDTFLSLWPEFPEEQAWSPTGGSAREPRFCRGQWFLPCPLTGRQSLPKAPPNLLRVQLVTPGTAV